MGLFSFLSPSSGAAAAPEEQRAVAVRTGAVAPSRQERARCYVARDAYFACLDAHGIVDSVADEAGARKACGAEDGQFEKDCAAQWVTYFKKWRIADIQKKAKIAALEAEGANKLDAKPDLTAVPAKR